MKRKVQIYLSFEVNDCHEGEALDYNKEKQRLISTYFAPSHHISWHMTRPPSTYLITRNLARLITSPDGITSLPITHPNHLLPNPGVPHRMLLHSISSAPLPVPTQLHPTLQRKRLRGNNLFAWKSSTCCFQLAKRQLSPVQPSKRSMWKSCLKSKSSFSNA